MSEIIVEWCMIAIIVTFTMGIVGGMGFIVWSVIQIARGKH